MPPSARECKKDIFPEFIESNGYEEMLLVAREAKFGSRAWPKHDGGTIDRDMGVRWDWGAVCVGNGAKGRFIVNQPNRNGKRKSSRNEPPHKKYSKISIEFDEQLTSEEFMERWLQRVKGL